jgi:formylglycine-generating enzyme required for sulfatase activity
MFKPFRDLLSIGVEMILIPSGRFLMGYDKGTEAEDPQSEKYVDAFYIDKYEATNKLYKECVSAGVCKPPTKINSNTHTDYYENRQFNNYPVINVDWHMAVTYCSWRDARLPTEPEWENAARGEDGRIYPWGNQAGYSYANYYNYKEDTTAVGSYEDGKSVYGVYDMAGNVREWTSSLFMVYPYKTNDGRENPDAKGARTFRGGAWSSASVTEIRTTYRSGADPSSSFLSLGFRCVHPVPEAPIPESILGTINADNSINCRLEPNLNGEIVDFLQPNSSVTILSRLLDSTWLLVKTPGVESCWASTPLITVTSGNLIDLPVNTLYPTSTVAP